MYPALRTTVLTASLALTTSVSSPAPVQAQTYQIDCAILLCLAGGWPTSVPCARARAEFIRRITPWPVEPPLQIWRCPMGASVSGGAPLSPMERLYDIAFREPRESTLPIPIEVPELILAQALEQADIDISGAAFDFVRSIRVYHIQFSQHQNRDGDCIRSDFHPARLLWHARRLWLGQILGCRCPGSFRPRGARALPQLFLALSLRGLA